MKNFIRQVKESAKQDIESDKKESILLIPSGSALLNCACSDSPYGAFKAGTIITLPGSSASGKTMLVFTMFAEICSQEKFDNYKLIYDDTEEALSLNIPLLFGSKTAQRIIPPRITNSEPDYSETIQDFQNNILIHTKKKKPFIYVLDSLDALGSDEEMEREYKKALISAKNPEAVKEIKGSYKVEKAKLLGQILRIIRKEIKNTKSLLVIIQQERANIGGGMFQKDTITSGGKAPFFYSSHQLWMKKGKSLKKNEKKIGNKSRVEVTKNKLTGKLRDIEFDIFYDYGIDDIGSCIDFLVQEEYWEKKGNIICAKEFDLNEIRSSLIRNIEENSLKEKLKKIVGDAWGQIENKLKLNRKSKYL